jgi:tetratricopeptide (TPR) repeat protein
MMPRSHIEVGDRLVWRSIVASGLPRCHLQEATVNYRTRHRAHYLQFGRQPPTGTKQIVPPALASPIITPAGLKPFKPVTPVPNVVKSTETFVQQGASGPTAGVSLCMIVRDEEKTLDRALRSVADLVQDIVIVDTGSTDATRSIASKWRARLVDFAWADDFAAARNESLRLAQGDWIFWLDADEFIDADNKRLLQQLFGMLKQSNCVYMMKQWSISEQPGGSTLVVDHARLFRNRPGLAWKYRIHEQILPSLQGLGDKVVFTDIRLTHHGYQDSQTRKQKLQRNLRILLKQAEELPDEPFTLFNLAGTYHDLGNTDQAVPLLTQAVEKAPKGAGFLGKAHVLLAQHQREHGNTAQALAWCQRGKKLLPRSPELWFEEGLVHKAMGNMAAAQNCFECILRLEPGPCYVGVDAGLRGHLTRHQLALTLAEQNCPAEAESQWRHAIKSTPHFGPAWLSLANLLLNHGRTDAVEELIAAGGSSPATGPIADVLRARLALARGIYQEACAAMQQAVAASPRSTWLRLLYSDILLRDGKDRAGAEAELAAVLAIDPQNKRAALQLEEIHRGG